MADSLSVETEGIIGVLSKIAGTVRVALYAANVSAPQRNDRNCRCETDCPTTYCSRLQQQAVLRTVQSGVLTREEIATIADAVRSYSAAHCA